jgi:hypothetical protein
VNTTTRLTSRSRLLAHSLTHSRVLHSPNSLTPHSLNPPPPPPHTHTHHSYSHTHTIPHGRTLSPQVDADFSALKRRKSREDSKRFRRTYERTPSGERGVSCGSAAAAAAAAAAARRIHVRCVFLSLFETLESTAVVRTQLLFCCDVDYRGGGTRG